MRKKKIIISLIMAVILTAASVVPIFASLYTSTLSIPEDIGSLITTTNNNDDLIHKYYLKITVNNHNRNGDVIITINESGNIIEYTIVYSVAYVYMLLGNNSVGNNTYFFATYFMNIGQNNDTYYLPLYINNCNITGIRYTNSLDNSVNVSIYSSTIIDQEQIKTEYYQLGYDNGYENGLQIGYTDGYNIGFSEALGTEEYTNLVGYVEQLIGRFTGYENAKYITPIAIVLVILFVYFLFIRFILSLIKAKGVIKTCDIIMLVACIILLVVMYAPMLDLTIKTNNTEQVETTTQEVYQIQADTQYRSYVQRIDTETGYYLVGPAGTVSFPQDKSSTTSLSADRQVESLEDLQERSIEYEEKE